MTIVKALVAARAGSERVQSKNTRRFDHTSLLENKILQLQRVPELDSVVVSSENDRILEIARALGCEAVLRDPSLATSDAPMSEAYGAMATDMDCDVIVYANCTNPLVRDRTVSTLIHNFLASPEHDSVNSASRMREFVFANGQPLNYDLRRQPRSQDLPEWLALNFAVNVLERRTMIESLNVVGSTPLLVPIDEREAVDIDTPFDFRLAELAYRDLGGIAWLTEELPRTSSEVRR